MATDTLRYAGFWPRLGSLLLDMLIMLPMMAFVTWAAWHYRLFRVYYVIPGTIFVLFYWVYLVRRFGGTPGKLIVGIRIRKLDGQPVGYREALLRHSADLIFGLLMSIATIPHLFHVTDAEYRSLSLRERAKHEADFAPSWFRPLRWTVNAWNCSELVVLLTNPKRRALHDFIAATVVVHASPNQSLEPTAGHCEVQL
jgi:uncharacterized RDD family membrane protein YckC